MSSELKPHLHLEVGHILFLDIVGYSKLLADEQRELIQELNQIVRETKQFRAAEAEGKLTRLPTGDGIVLVFTNNPEAPRRVRPGNQPEIAKPTAAQTAHGYS